MHHHYFDIRRHISAEPKWFDENGVPRWDDFEPKLSADIYATQVVLLRIECQSCGRPFDVCMSVSDSDLLLGRVPHALEHQVKDQSIHYGDPPNIECCPSGPTMNSVPKKVLQFWKHGGHKPRVPEWIRVPELEVDIVVDW